MNKKNYPFAKRTDWDLASNAIMTACNELKEADTPIINLTESNPTHCHFSSLQHQDLSLLSDPSVLHYAPSPQGLPAAREAIAHNYKKKGIEVAADQIFLTSSTSEAYTFLLRLLVDHQDTVLLPRPSYPLFEFLLDINDVKIAYYHLVPSFDWSIDFAILKKAVSDQIKAIVLVHPNNPTGSYVQPQEIAELNRLCQEHDVALICDEVFWDYDFDQYLKRQSFVQNEDVLTFTLGGLSKALALPQMKLSWIVVNGPTYQVLEAKRRLELIADTYLSVNTPVQYASCHWLRTQESLRAEIMERLRHNLRYLKKACFPLEDVNLMEPQGGWYAILDCGNDLREEEFVLQLLKEAHVFVHPGYFFDFTREGFLIVSLLPPLEEFKKGVSLLVHFLEHWEREIHS